LGWIDVLTRIIPNLKSTIGGLDVIFDQVIGEHETEKIDDDQPNRLDFVHFLLRLQKNSMLDFEFTKDNLKAILLVSLSLSLSHSLSQTHTSTQTDACTSKSTVVFFS
jgi:hypothetical protein